MAKADVVMAAKVVLPATAKVDHHTHPARVDPKEVVDQVEVVARVQMDRPRKAVATTGAKGWCRASQRLLWRFSARQNNI